MVTPAEAAAIEMREQTLVADEGVTKLPIDLHKIADDLGVEIKYADLKPNIDGFILRESGKNACIYVNQNHNEHRKRFTIAHELGHYWDHRDDQGEYGYVDYRNEMSSTGRDPKERYANSFAAELLMPAKYILVAWARGDSIKKLRKTLNVSEAALGHRLINLGLLGDAH